MWIDKLAERTRDVQIDKLALHVMGHYNMQQMADHLVIEVRKPEVEL